MNKIIDNIRKFLKLYITTFVISIIIGVTIILLFYFLQGQSIVSILNGATIAFVIFLSFGGLAFVTRQGMFDSLSYGFNQLFSSMFGKDANKYNDFNTYKDDKNSKRTSSPHLYLLFLLVGLIFAIVTAILFIVVKAQGLY